MRTFSDQIQQIADSLAITDMTDRVARLAKAAVRACYNDIGTRHEWKYLIRWQLITLTAPYSVGTVAYIASTRTLTLTGGTWPSWVEKGVILLNRNVYAVERMVDSTNLILQTGRCPIDDVASGAGYNLAQTTYDLPADFLGLRALLELERLWSVSYLSPEDLLARTQLWFYPGTVFFYTILGGSNGRMQLMWSPPPGEERTFNLLYQAKPRPFGLQAPFTAGTIATTAGSTTVTITGGVLPQNIAGCVCRVGTASIPPDPLTGDNPYTEEFIVKTRVSNTQFTATSPAVNTVTAALYQIDDPIDITWDPLLTYFDAMCESRTLLRHQASIDRVGFADRMERQAYIKAMEADDRFTPRGLMAGGVPGNLHDLLFGVTPHGAA